MGFDHDITELLDEIEALHAAVWTHFDPTGRLGDKKQPKDIKRALAGARKTMRQFGRTPDGWQK